MRKRNPHLYPSGPLALDITKAVPKRLRQSSKPLMNKLEYQFERMMTDAYPELPLRAQAITFRLANGLRYTPDFVSFSYGIGVKAWEVKGKWVDGDSFPKLKMAAALFPEIVWTLAWKGTDGIWQQQIILP